MASKKHQRVLKVKEGKENYFLEEYQIKFIGGKIIYVKVKVRHGHIDVLPTVHGGDS
jgi:hypothetical protein